MTSLAEAMNEYGSQAYLLTVATDGPHTSQVNVTLTDNQLHCALGTSARRNIGTNNNVSVLWPARQPGGYDIIVNGTLTLDAATATHATIVITKSVFHRPGKPQTPGATCPADCQQLTVQA